MYVFWVIFLLSNCFTSIINNYFTTWAKFHLFFSCQPRQNQKESLKLLKLKCFICERICYLNVYLCISYIYIIYIYNFIFFILYYILVYNINACQIKPIILIKSVSGNWSVPFNCHKNQLMGRSYGRLLGWLYPSLMKGWRLRALVYIYQSFDVNGDETL